jgi:hypothetical protein
LPNHGGGSTGTSILTTAAPPGSAGASASVVLAEGVAGLDVHIYHHHLPQTPQQLPLQPPSQTGGHPTLILGSPGSAPSATDEITPGTGTAAVPATVGALAPTTLVTINTTNNSTTTTTTAATGAPAAASAAAGAGASSASAAPKEKSGPQYEDAAKMEQDLLTVERYKISAGKAIPV